METKRILIAAGGTGGHLYPGLALANILKNWGHEVRFAVRPNDLAIPILKTQGFAFDIVRASGFPRTISPKKAFSSLLNVGFGLKDALSIVRSWKPHAVVGMGGHIAFPAAIAGKIHRIPVIIHEQNVLPGITNRILSWTADAVGISFPETAKKLGKKSVVVGNPVREQFRNAPSAKEARKTFGLDETRMTVFVFGGSLGATAINEHVVLSLPFLAKAASSIQFLHLAGPRDHGELEKEYRSHHIMAKVLERTEQMATAYATADLVIARAGATTVAELAVARKPAILIPYPHASENHQLENARWLARHGWVDIIDQKELDSSLLANLIQNRLKKPLRGTPLSLPDPLQAASFLADLVEKTAH